MQNTRLAIIAIVFVHLILGCQNKPGSSITDFSRRIKEAQEQNVPYEEIFTLVDSAITAYPEEASFYFERGICKFHLLNDTGEIADLSHAIMLAKGKDYKTYRMAVNVRGFRWMHQGKHQAAFDDFWELATSNSPCQEPASSRWTHYWNAGLVARHLLRFDLVDSVIQQWKLIDSTSSGLKKLYAETYRLKEMPQEALMVYDALLQDTLERDDYHLWISRAKTLKSLGKDKAAQQDLAVAKALIDGHLIRIKDSLALSDALAEFLFLKGDYPTSIHLCDRFTQEADPLMRSKLYSTRGDAMQATGNLAQACADWKQAVELGWVEAEKKQKALCGI